MNIPKKTLFIASIIFIIIIALLTSASRMIVLESYTRLEEQNVRTDVQRVQDSIADVAESIKSSAADWALRNGTYDFITNGSTDYIENHLGNTEISVLKLNFMVFVNPSGKVVYAKFLDWKNKKEIPEPKNLLKALLSAVDYSDKKDIAGILMIPQFPVLIVSKPVRKRNLSGDIRGFLIAGRFLDTGEITRIGKLTHLKPDIRTPDPPISDDYKTALAQIRRGNRMPVFPSAPASIAGYALHNDLYGKPAFILKVEKSREIYRLGQKTIFYHTLFLIFIGFFFILFIRLSLSSSSLQKKNSEPEQEISVHKQTIGTLSDEGREQSAESESPANISHDIRTCMNAIMGFTELLSSLVTDERQKNYIRMIQSNSERLLPLIRKIFNLSETETEKSDIRDREISFGLHNAAAFGEHSSAEAKEQSVEKNILSENSTILIADDVNVNRLLLKAFFKDTNIRILEAENGREAVAAAEQNLPDVVLMDIGMPVMDGIEAAKRIKENITSKTISVIAVTAHAMPEDNHRIMSAGFDGYLQKPVCRSVLFQELFRFIPRSAEENILEKLPVKKSVNYANILFENVTILIADDVEDNRSLLKEFFQDMNVRIIEVEDGLQAVAAAEQILPDVILMDINMPVMDGYEAVKQIRKNRKSENIPVIAITGHAMTGEKKPITEAGFDRCISKPFRLATLFQELSRFIPYTVKDR